MRVLVTKGQNAGRVLDMGTRQAEGAIANGWAQLPTDPQAGGDPEAATGLGPDGNEEPSSPTAPELEPEHDPGPEPSRFRRGKR